MSFSRRGFLRLSGGAIAGGLTSSLALPAFANIAAPALVNMGKANCRSIGFDNLHTGEKLSVDYWVDGSYRPDALASVNHVLRDWRTGDVRVMDPKLIDLLSALNEKIENSAPIQVICGYRSPATNAKMHEASSGVAVHSLHMVGQAIDIRMPGKSLDLLHKTALSQRSGGVGYYPTSNFVHVDVGAVRTWQGV